MKPWKQAVTILTLLLSTSSTTIAAPLSDARRAELDSIVKQDCGSCHGLTLKGGLGPDLNPQRLQQFPEGFLKITIQHGRPGTPMPPWSALLNSDEIDYIATQLRSGIWYVP